MSDSSPELFPRRVLLCIAGLYPQVVTETLYALVVQPAGAFVPTEIRVISTEEGVKRARLMLFSPEQDHFARLCADYALPKIQFDASSLMVLRGRSGPLSDIRTQADNADAADQITEAIRELTEDPELALHVSIAGGRKTMGFYAGYALSMFGRKQDRLSHVLVNEAFESNAAFFYPPPQSRVLILDKTRPVETSEAAITLADIPFVRLRHLLVDAVLNRSIGFAESVAEAEQQFGAPSLAFLLASGSVHCGQVVVPMKPMSLTVFALLANRAKSTEDPLSAAELSRGAVNEEVLAIYRAIGNRDAHAPAVIVLTQRLRTDPLKWFREHMSRVNASLRAHLSAANFMRYRIVEAGKRNQRSYALALPAEAIQIDKKLYT